MEMNSPLAIVSGFAVIGLFAGALAFVSSLTPFVDLALQNPLFAGVIVLSVVFLIIFGDPGSRGGGGDGG